MSDRETSTPEQLAVRLGLSTQTIYRHLRAGDLRGAKIGSKWIILDADADAWFDAHVPTAVDVDPQPAAARPPLRRSQRRRGDAGGLRAFIATQGGHP